MSLDNLIKNYNVEDIEKSLIINYIRNNQINPNDHKDLKEYLTNYTINEDLVSRVSLLEHSSLSELAVDMEILISSEDRQTNGAFFTPRHIVDYIIRTVNPTSKAKIIDISCGCGAFLLGAIRFLQQEYKKTIQQIIKDNIFGIDLMDYNVRRCKLLIILYGLQNHEIINMEDINVKAANTLTYKWGEKYDVVVGNPPYVKVQDMEDDTRAVLTEKYKTTCFGSYNLYFAFFEIGLSILKDDGILGYITPNNYFTSLSGESLRTYFNNTQYVNKIVDFGSKKVFQVQTYTAITFLTKYKNQNINYAKINNRSTIEDFLDNPQFTENPYSSLKPKKWRLLCENDREIISRIESCGERLGDLFNISVGIATLKDEVYSFNVKDEEGDCYICDNKYKTNFKIEKSISRSSVKISTIRVQEDLQDNNRKIIFPYTISSKNTALVIEEDTLKEQCPNCYSYLLSMKEILATRGKGKHKYTPFYAYGRTQALNKHGVKIYTPTFSQYPRFIYDYDEDSLFTNGYALFFKETSLNKNLYSSLENPIKNKENADVLVKILNSGLMHFYISKTSVSIEGGYPCYQKNFIESFNIPQLSSSDIDAIRALQNKDDIDNLLLSLYQINCPSPNLWE